MSKRASESQVEYNARRRSQYASARNIGYTAEEARTTRGILEVTFERRTRRKDVFSFGGDPLDNYKRWSRKRYGFPDDVLDWIHTENEARGNDENHHFGFRYYYHRYVDRFPEADALDAAQGVKT